MTSHDQRHRQHQLELDVLHRGADRGGAVGEHGDLDRRRQGGAQLRQQSLDTVHHRDHVWRRAWRWMFTMTAGVPFIQAAWRTFSASSITSATFSEGDRGIVAERDDQGLVVPARQELVVGPDDRGLARPVETALGLVDVGGRHRGRADPRGEAVGRERGRVGLHPHRGPLTAADADEADSRQLSDLLGEPRIGQVLDLGERQTFVEVSRA